MVRKIVADHKINCDHLLGQFLDESHYDVVIDEDCDFFTVPPCSSIEKLNCNIDCTGCPKGIDEERAGFIFRKGYFTREEQIGAYEGLHRATDIPSNNRGLASGPKVEKVGNRDWLTACQDEILTYMKKGKRPLPGFDPIQEIIDKYAGSDKETTRGCMWLYYATRNDNFVWDEWLEWARSLDHDRQKEEAQKVEDKYISISTYASTVFSGVAGSYDRYPRIPYARYCAYNRDQPEQFAKSFPFLQKLNDGFKEYLPQRWSNQRAACDQIDERFVVPGTVFTTITVNRTFRTAAHLDAGDLERGFSNLSVFTDGESDYTGGLLVLPEYRTAVNIRPGDLLLIANHNVIHGNTPIEGTRFSVVAYFREGLIGTGSKEYEDARFEYVESRKRNVDHPLHKKLWNGVSPGMWEEQEWYDFLESKLGRNELIKYHPRAAGDNQGASLDLFFG